MAVTWNDRILVRNVGDDVERRLNKAGRVVASEMRRLMRLPKSGAPPPYLYGSKTRYKGRQTRHHGTQRSAPGEAPAVQTSNLIEKIHHELVNSRTVRAGIYGPKADQAPYGRTLEFGTRRMRARPWARPALFNSRNLVKRIFAGERGLRFNYRDNDL